MYFIYKKYRKIKQVIYTDELFEQYLEKSNLKPLCVISYYYFNILSPTLFIGVTRLQEPEMDNFYLGLSHKTSI